MAEKIYILPSSKLINALMEEYGLGYFDEKTGLSDQIGGRELTENGIQIAIGTLRLDYDAGKGVQTILLDDSLARLPALLIGISRVDKS